MGKREKDLRLGASLEAYGGVLTDKQRVVAHLYYMEDLSLSEIAKDANISRQGVQDTLNRARRRLYDMEARLQLVGRGQEVRNGV